MNKQNYSYGWEKLYNAVRILIGSGDLKQRLLGAFIEAHTLANGEHLPDKLQKEFDDLYKKMTSAHAVGDEGAIQATINSLGPMELQQSAEKILSLYDNVCRH